MWNLKQDRTQSGGYFNSAQLISYNNHSPQISFTHSYQLISTLKYPITINLYSPVPSSLCVISELCFVANKYCATWLPSYLMALIFTNID